MQHSSAERKAPLAGLTLQVTGIGEWGWRKGFSCARARPLTLFLQYRTGTPPSSSFCVAIAACIFRSARPQLPRGAIYDLQKESICNSEAVKMEIAFSRFHQSKSESLYGIVDVLVASTWL